MTAREVVRRIEALGGSDARRGHPAGHASIDPATVAAGAWRRVVALMAHESPYRVVVRRDPEDARFWLADVEGLDGAHTYARSLGALDRYVREVIVLAAELPDEAEDELTLEWDYHTGDPGLDEEAAQLRRQREVVEAETRRIAEQTAELARRMVTEGRYSVRDAAALLAVSPARVGQVASRRALRRQPRSGRPADR